MVLKMLYFLSVFFCMYQAVFSGFRDNGVLNCV